MNSDLIGLIAIVFTVIVALVIYKYLSKKFIPKETISSVEKEIEEINKEFKEEQI